jgi:thiamine biosynthesis lipoprotein
MPKHKKTPSITAEGLGTRWIIELIGGEEEFPLELSNLIKSTIALFDDTYSRFKPDSLMGQLNRKTLLTNPPRDMVEMFDFAHKMHTATNGVFDISVGGSLQKLGYGNDNGSDSVYAGFWNEAVYNTKEIRIPSGSAVDFGGFGKGWLLDQLAVLLEQHAHQFYVINGGGDIVLSSPKPIELGLEHPYDPTKIIGTTQLTKGALAVSSVVKRRWIKDGQSYHHIIDPVTAKPADNGVVSTYVKGTTALITDTLSKIVLLRPELEAKLRSKFDIQTIIIREDQLS